MASFPAGPVNGGGPSLARLPPAAYFPCYHLSSWKRIRAKKGVNHFVCCLCGVRWKGSRFYLQFITRPPPKASVGSTPCDEVEDEDDDEEEEMDAQQGGEEGLGNGFPSSFTM